MEAFVEAVRGYPCLYDKSNFEFKDKELRANRWHIIEQQFGMTGEQAAAKFKILRDRWLKISLEKKKAYRSGAPGKDGKKKDGKERTNYAIVDNILRNTPYYAEKLTTNIPLLQNGHLQQAEEALSTSSVAGDCCPSPSPAEELLDEICSARTPMCHSDDEESCRLLTSIPIESAAASGSNRAQPSPQPSQARLSVAPQSRKRKNDAFEQAVQEALGSCSSTLSSIQRTKEHAVRSAQAPPDECQEAVNWTATKLRKLPPRKRSEILFKIHSLIFEAEMELPE